MSFTAICDALGGVRKHMSISLMALTFLGGCLCQNPEATPVRPARQSIRSSGGAATQLTQADPDGPTLGPQYTGDDIVALIRRVQSSAATKPKSEFETTAEYEARIATSPLKAKKCVFVIPTLDRRPALGGAQLTYNADHQSFVAEVETWGEYLTADPADASDGKTQTLPLKVLAGSTGTYVGQNAYGAKAVVTQTTGVAYGLAFLNDNGLFNSKEFTSEWSATIHVTASPDIARTLKAELVLAIVCIISRPVLYESVTGGSATISNPHEVHIKQFFLPVVPEQLVIFNRRSGKVLSRTRGKSKSSGDTDKHQGTPGEGDSETKQFSPQQSGVFRVGGGVIAPQLISKVEPGYSEEALQTKFEGTVILYVVVDEQGNPRDLKVVRPLGLGLDEKAMEAVKKWRFAPGLRDGKPVAVATQIEVTFRLLKDQK